VIVVRDAVGVDVALEAPAARVVSLVPSVTESLFDLGCGDRLVGCTRFCVRPAAGVAGVEKVGGTKDPELGRILELRPDLVLANREENREADVEALRRSVPVHVSYPRDLPGLLAYLADLGALLGVPDRARNAAREIVRAREALRAPARPPRVLYLIWRSPWMAAGPDTFIDGMLRECGFRSVIDAGTGRYPEVDLASFRGRLDAVLLSSEPFPFSERHRPECALATGLDAGRVQPVSGEAFSWFGTRTGDAFAEAARVHALIGA
jgi:ABC-type Fe3+-hydroxamate transport system substrate-binding protein